MALDTEEHHNYVQKVSKTVLKDNFYVFQNVHIQME
jgi:hypothetical protein